jgi:parallel beta-helix repeat protein
MRNLLLVLLALTFPTVATAAPGVQSGVTCPAGSIAIFPGASIQAAVTAGANGATFCIKAGTHVQQQVKPKLNQTFVGETGATMDGQNVAIYAFQAISGGTGVTVKNLHILNYKTGFQRGAIHGDSASGWTVRDSAVSYSESVGIRSGASWTISNNKVFRNGVIGISGFRAHNTSVTGNDVYENKFLQAPELPVNAEAAGIKFGETGPVSIMNNLVHNNFAKGIWVDHQTGVSTITGNTIDDNSHQGIFVEISCGAVVATNTVRRNGFGRTDPGILVTNSPDVEVHSNIVLSNAQGIRGGQTTGANAATSPICGVLESRNLWVHDNTILMMAGRTGFQQNVDDPTFYSAKNVRFTSNSYYVGTAQTTFWTLREALLTITQWRGYGMDTSGVVRPASEYGGTTTSAPTAPTSLAVTATTATSIALSWVDASTDETGFEIQRSRDGVTYSVVGTAAANATTYSSTGQLAGTQYYFRVRAVNATLFSSFSNAVSSTTLVPPTAPTGLRITAATTITVGVAWLDTSTTETSFEVDKITDGGAIFSSALEQLHGDRFAEPVAGLT